MNYNNQLKNKKMKNIMTINKCTSIYIFEHIFGMIRIKFFEVVNTCPINFYWLLKHDFDALESYWPLRIFINHPFILEQLSVKNLG